MMQRLLMIPMIALLLSACMADDGDDPELSSLELNYDGNESGQQSESGDCDSDGRITGEGNAEDGSLKIEVVDGTGEIVFDRTYDADFGFESETVTGNAGNWTLRATRSGDDLVGDPFRGRYNFLLLC